MQKPTLIETERRRRARGRPALGPGEGVLTPKLKARVIYMLEEGATLTEIARTKGMPSHYAIRLERKRDPKFDDEIKEARLVGVAVKLDLCAENAEREAESRDPDRMRVAQMLAAVTTVYAEKIAPKQFGQLVKLGSDPDLPFAVNVINYSDTLINGGSLIPVDSGNENSDTRAEETETLAASAGNDADTASRGSRSSKRAVSADRPRPGGRSLAKSNRQTTPQKARQVARKPKKTR